MKIKSFSEHLEKRLDKEEIKEIEQAAKIEFDALQALQNEVSQAVIHYMSDNNIGFNDMVSKLGKSPSQLSKIIKGEANLTVSTIAQISSIMGYKPHLHFAR
ncbi:MULTISPECIES: helix-turn-helix domain-containing protein [Cysteiniphilum]|uniref:HTH cro/C1-type domain-containing protein n=1 Tax=Cysteiniphilum litorale TaxID=2056700 RepID=A0A8J2Z717_9GAMM|nr:MULTISPECIES: helix-turn-helix transcriptional regulator [Cysteiniphilum]MDA0911588.1 helix-turn-helix domain-containing protein [Pseudomonadota bacterium]GGG07582.1 hypothetical protein GCM10010995_26420 [Cysteiniphilum litorale]